MEEPNFTGKLRPSGNSLIVTVDSNIVQLLELKEDDFVQVHIKRLGQMVPQENKG